MAAMAAVRFAARRLTGQQAQAILRPAVANQQGVLNRGGGGSPASALRRFTSSEAPASASKGPRINTEHPSFSGDVRLRAAHQKKEELFELLSEIQMNKDYSRTIRMKDRRLLHYLTSHVDHKPGNPQWRRYFIEHAVNFCLAGIVKVLASLYMFEKWSSYFHRKKQLQGADNNSEAIVSCAEPNMEA